MAKLTLEEENALLKLALQKQIDYHHVIGNRDVNVSNADALRELYKIAKDTLDTINQTN